MNEALRKFMNATAQADEAVKELIRVELREMIADAERKRDDAAARVKKSYDALQEARKPIDELECEIQTAENNAAEWLERKTGADLGYRVEAPVWQERWAEEIARLRDKHTEISIQVSPCEKEHAAAKREYAEAARYVEELQVNLMEPYIAHGQDMEAYRLYRQGYGSIARILLFTDERHPEWEPALEWLRNLADLAGFDLVPNGDRKTKAAADAMLREYREKHTTEPASAMLIDKMEDSPASDDYRFNAMPVHARAEMQVPGIPLDYKQT